MHANNILRVALSQRSASLTLRLTGHPAFANSPALLPRRYLSTNNDAPSLHSGRIGDKPGVEGLHQLLKGDWVLFHPVYTPAELEAVEVMFREAKTFQDKIAAGFVKFLRWGFDFVSMYKHKEIPPNSSMTLQQLREGGYTMDPSQWLARIIFLETTAAVPGMVAATLRHLRSLRLMKRDSGWIHTLLEEAENERMHLMTFLTLRDPPIWLRSLCLGAQGVFYNVFFFSYIISPRTCHRFVGHLEEEAVLTYTKCIKDIEEGRLPEWSNHPAPEIAKDYWRLKPDATMLDVVYAVRSDESTHRFVNHSLANLKYETDVNPFAFGEPDMHTKGTKLGFERNEADAYVEYTRKLFENSEKGTNPTGR
ncbi:alternative oxidase [Thelephora ganbajun]|uniref:Alternative oxidase n=1 Tax=Thelephora ganbajun TaxID=370292 RepID=A0ACB6ZQD1_THEGA|nr:alternative oxidase [Thelephora ganbajun]